MGSRFMRAGQCFEKFEQGAFHAYEETVAQDTDECLHALHFGYAGELGLERGGLSCFL